MTTLRVIVDQIVAPVPGGIGRYAEELTRQLIATAPRGSRVAGVVSASPESDYALIGERLPGLVELYKSPLARRELAAAWQHGFTRLPGSGMVHATSLLAPLHRRDRLNNPGEQTVVTIHDAVAWTHPELAGRAGNWARAMGKRAERYADAVVVPTHAVADQLSDYLTLGSRVRVIAGAPSSALALPPDVEDRAARLDLPDRYLLTSGGFEPRKGVDLAVSALASAATDGLPLLVLGGDGAEGEFAELAASAQVKPERVRGMGRLDDGDLAVVLSRAAVFIQASRAEGFGMTMLDALAAGVPVVLSDVSALVEVAADAGTIVQLGDEATFVENLASAIGDLLHDRELATRLSIAGRDRSRAFSWRDSAEKVWQLHADL